MRHILNSAALAAMTLAGNQVVAASAEVPAAWNLVICVDLSDRICQKLHKGQGARDMATISAILDVFEKRVAEQLYLFSRDRLVLTVMPQPCGYEELIRETADSLRIDMTQLRGGRPAFTAARAQFQRSLAQVYEAAVKEETFLGADLWAFVLDLRDYEMPGARNVLVLAVDGYPALEPSLREGRPEDSYLTARDFAALRSAKPTDLERPRLAPIQNLDLSAWEVILLEVQPRYLQDRQILERLYCEDFFASMGVGATRCRLVLGKSEDQTREVVERWLRSR